MQKKVSQRLTASWLIHSKMNRMLTVRALTSNGPERPARIGTMWFRMSRQDLFSPSKTTHVATTDLHSASPRTKSFLWMSRALRLSRHLSTDSWERAWVPYSKRRSWYKLTGGKSQGNALWSALCWAQQGGQQEGSKSLKADDTQGRGRHRLRLLVP